MNKRTVCFLLEMRIHFYIFKIINTLYLGIDACKICLYVCFLFEYTNNSCFFSLSCRWHCTKFKACLGFAVRCICWAKCVYVNFCQMNEHLSKEFRVKKFNQKQKKSSTREDEEILGIVKKCSCVNKPIYR